MLGYKKKSQIVLLLILIIFTGISSNFFRNLTEVILYKFDDRIAKEYGFCSDESIGYLLYLKNKYKIKDNPKIVNYIHSPSVNWAIINTKTIDKKSENLIWLNYPGPELRINLNKINTNLFEFRDAHFFSNKFNKIKSMEIINNSGNFEKINWKLEIIIVDKFRKKENFKTLNIENFLDKNLKIKLNIFFKNLQLNEKRIYFKIKNNNISKFQNLKLHLILENKYILENFQIIDNIDNCYYVR